ncbi:hypothetical protein [Christiangramia sp.]|uniref:hypothetical protein n=1 Tax=Christiangramia sp. TaxID=1931228 RepID=UPI00261647E4|nr:hypothetical protein [Christiangramia sp.]
MRIKEKQETIELLEELRILNYKSAYMYKIMCEAENRLMLKNFYMLLHQQKIEFRQDIEEKIEQLKTEISPTRDPRMLSFYKRKKCKLAQYYLKYKLRSSYADIHKREWKSYKKYNKFLSRINHACVREILLEHKHQIKINLTNMNNTGIIKYPVK